MEMKTNKGLFPSAYSKTQILKYKIIKINNNLLCSFCHKNSKESLVAEIWWEDSESETFHHILHLNCFYNFLKELTPNKENKKMIKELEYRYLKELVISFLK